MGSLPISFPFGWRMNSICGAPKIIGISTLWLTWFDFYLEIGKKQGKLFIRFSRLAGKRNLGILWPTIQTQTLVWFQRLCLVFCLFFPIIHFYFIYMVFFLTRVRTVMLRNTVIMNCWMDSFVTLMGHSLS